LIFVNNDMKKGTILIILGILVLLLVGSYFLFNKDDSDIEKPRYNSEMEKSFRVIVESELTKQQSIEYGLVLKKLFVSNTWSKEDGTLYKTQGYILLTTEKELTDEDFDDTEGLERVFRSISESIQQQYLEEYKSDSSSWVTFEIKSPNYPPAGSRLSKEGFEYLGFKV